MSLTQKQKEFSGMLSILAATLCWGFSGCSGQYLLHDLSLPTPVVLCIRQISAGLILICLDFLAGSRRKGIPSAKYRDKTKGWFSSAPSVWKSREDTVVLIIFSVFGICLCQFTFFMSIYYSDSGTATVLQYLSTIIILIVSCVRTKTVPCKTETAAVLAAVLGTFLISVGGNTGGASLSGYALFFGLVCALSYSTYTLIPGRLVRTYGARYIVGRGMFISGIFFSVFVRPWTYHIDVTPQIILGFCGLILIGTAAGSTLYHFGASLLPPVKAGTLANFDPVSSVLLTALLLGTSFTITDIMGFVLIIGAVFLIHLKKARNKD